MVTTLEVLFMAGFLTLGLYLAWIIWLIGQWRRPGLSAAIPAGASGATIVIAARNEAAGLPELMNSLATQTMPAPVIFVDDHSTDDTAAIIKSWSSVSYLSLPPHRQGKKAALTTAITTAKTPFILATDADVVLSPRWTGILAAQFAAGAKVVTGPVLIRKGRGILLRLQQWDLLSFAGITAAGLKSGCYVLANGANLGFSKQAFQETGGYAAHQHVPGGDDVFTVAAIVRRYPGSAIYVQDPDAVVYTRPQTSWRALFRQRKRWGAKMAAMAQPWLWVFVGTILVTQLCWFLFFLAAWIKPVFWIYFMLYSALKLRFEYKYLSELARFARVSLHWWEIFWISPAHGVFLWVTALLSLWPGGYDWKGRRYT